MRFSNLVSAWLLLLFSCSLVAANNEGKEQAPPLSLRARKVKERTTGSFVARARNLLLGGSGRETIAADSAGPTAVDDEFITDKDEPVVIRPLLNDKGPDGTTSDGMYINHFSQGKHGIVATAGFGGGELRYTPDAGFVGTDDFQYVITDGNQAFDTGTVKVIVADVVTTTDGGDDSGTDSGSAGTDTALIAQDIEVTIDANDSELIDVFLGTGYDPIPEYESSTSPTNGSLDYKGDGVFMYTPFTDFIGEDYFTYTIFADGQGGLSTGTVFITVIDESLGDTGGDDSGTGTALVAKDIEVTINANDSEYIYVFSDAGYDPIPEMESFTQPESGSGSVGLPDNVQYPGDGTLIYDPNRGFTGDDYFTYTIEDGVGGLSTAKVYITVVGESLSDTGGDDSGSGGESTTLIANDVEVTIEANNWGYVYVLGYDASSIGNFEMVDSFSEPSSGTLRYLGYGTFVYTPNTDFDGKDSFEYTIVDRPTGAESTATATIFVVDLGDTDSSGVTTTDGGSGTDTSTSSPTGGTPYLFFDIGTSLTVSATSNYFQVTVDLSKAVDDETVVRFSTGGGTATKGVDYSVPTPQLVDILPWNTEATTTITLLALVGGDETFQLTAQADGFEPATLDVTITA